MKKIITLVCAAIFSLGLMAETDVFDQTGASSGNDMAKTSATLPGTYIAGQGGGNIVGYTPNNKGIKLNVKTTTYKIEETNYGYVVLNVKEGFLVKGVKLEGTSNSSNNIVLLGVYADVNTENLATAIPAATNQLASSTTFPNKNTNYISSPALTFDAESNVVFVFDYSGSDSQMRAIFTVTYEQNCTNPGTALALDADKKTEVYAGEEVTFSTTGGNGGVVTITGANSETISENKWTATAGKHTFTASQALYEGKCPQEAKLVIEVAACKEADTDLSLSSDAAAVIYEDDVITFSTTGGNGGTVTVAGSNSETISDNKWTAVAGSHTFIASQEKTGLYCATESQLVLNVIEKTPVTTVTISGASEAYKGETLTYVATAENASKYEWYVNDEQQGSDSAKLIFTVDKGSYSIVCKARNKFNVEDENPVWISSEEKELIVTNPHGELIKAVHNGSATGATVTGVIGGTVDKLTQDGGKFGSNGHYFGIRLAKGAFFAGDTLNVNVKTASSGGRIVVYADKSGNTPLYDTETLGVVGDNKFVLPESVNGKSIIYVCRPSDANKWNAVVNFLSVTRPVDVKSVTETLTAVTIDDEPMSEENLAALISAKSIILADAYLNAPVVKFTKHTVITYDDESTKESDEVIEKTAQETTASRWVASATIGETSYSVYTTKKLSYVVTYKLGTKTLGTENVAQNSSPANYATYQTLNDGNLSTFKAWYTDADLAEAHKVANIAAAVITEATTFYAEFEYKYATSINIESLILEHGTSYDTKGQLGTQNFASNYSSEGMDVSNDSLNNDKGANRNYDYLGLKVKSISLLGFRLENGKTVKIKFGDVKTTPQVSINGGDYAAITITDKVYSHTASADELISFKVTEGNKAVVIKQIVIGDAPALEDVVYAINCADATNGTVSCSWAIGVPGETVALTVTPASGYVVSSVKVNNAPIEADAQGKYSFQMPAAAANVAATFSVATALDNTDDAVKATKRIVNGQLIIEKNGEVYNVLGARVR